MSEPQSLDDLFSVAKQHINAGRREAAALAATRAKAPKHIKAGDSIAPADPRYADPEAWERKRGVALIHDETQTLLGNFIEWRHKTDAGARRLLRTEEPCVIDATEYVEGDWWLAAELEVAPVEAWHEKRSAVAHLVLPQMGVHSPACPLIVHLSYGAIARVELEVATTFAQMEGAALQLLQLPAGVNVLPLLSKECKMQIWMEVQA